MNGGGPTGRAAWDELENPVFRRAVTGDIPVTIEQPLWEFLFRVQADEVTEVLIVQPGETGGDDADVRWTDQNLRRAQFVRHDLKVVERIRAGAELLRAAAGHRCVHRIFVIVVAGPDAEGEAALLEIVDALDARGVGLGLGERRQKHGRQNGQHGHDDKQGDEGETV